MHRRAKDNCVEFRAFEHLAIVGVCLGSAQPPSSFCQRTLADVTDCVESSPGIGLKSRTKARPPSGDTRDAHIQLLNNAHISLLSSLRLVRKQACSGSVY
jgi:hypothetical protein